MQCNYTDAFKLKEFEFDIIDRIGQYARSKHSFAPNAPCKAPTMTTLVVPTSSSPSSASWNFQNSGTSSPAPSFRVDNARIGFVRAGYGTDWSNATRAEVSLVHYTEPDYSSLLDQLRAMAEACVGQTGPFWKSIDDACLAMSSSGNRVCTRSDFVWSIFQVAVAKTFGVKFGVSLWSTVLEVNLMAPPMIMGFPVGGCTRVKAVPTLMDEIQQAFGSSDDNGKPYLKIAFVLKSVRIVKSAKAGTYNAYVDAVFKGCSKSSKPVIADAPVPKFSRSSIPDDAQDAAELKALFGMEE